MNQLSIFAPQASFSETLKMAELFCRSDFCPKDYKGKPHDLIWCWEYGAALGVNKMQAPHGIKVINGKPSAWGDMLLGICMAHPDFEDKVETIETREMMVGDKTIEYLSATCIIKRRGRSETKYTFTEFDAKKAGLWTKQGPWQTHPPRMLQAKARGFALRDAFADILCGLITREEALDYPTDDDKQVTARVHHEAIEAIPLIDEETTEYLKFLLAERGMFGEPEKLAEYLQRFGATAIAELSQATALGIISKIEQKYPELADQWDEVKLGLVEADFEEVETPQAEAIEGAE